MAALQRNEAGFRQLHVGLVGDVVAGIETQFHNVRAVVERDPDLSHWTLPVHPFRAGDAAERYLRMLPASTRSTMRQTVATAPLFARRDLDVIWTQVSLPLLPWVASSRMLRHAPFVYTTDCTPGLLRGFKAHYGYWGGRSPLKQRLRDALYSYFVGRAALLIPWTSWTARSLTGHYGVPESRVAVLPPGVDTDFWRPGPESGRIGPKGPVRLVFVGGDFERKGGDLLLDVYRERLQGKVVLDLVTRRSMESSTAITVHSGLGPNDDRLRSLYQRADIFVLPTRADCFSMAGLEAMAVGLPIVICPVGGVAELFRPGREGLFVPPDDGRALAQAVEGLVVDVARRKEMGKRARQLAIKRYSSETNTNRLLDLLRSVASATEKGRLG
jgi:glycosyltransferase involved in cell wall biosynthesis